MRTVYVTPLCFEDHLTEQVMYLPTSTVLASVLTYGVPPSCIGIAPGVQICGDLPSEPDSPTMVSNCFEGKACIDRPLTVTACPASGTEVGFIIDPTCYPPGAAGVSIYY